MFNFMKKGVGVSGERDREKIDRDEKERRKREKKSRKEAKQGVSGSMSSEELLRLDEAKILGKNSNNKDDVSVRRSLKIRGRRKEKEKLPSGITADYSAEFFAHLDIDRSAFGSDDISVSGGSAGGGGGSSIELDRGTEEILASATTTTTMDHLQYNNSGTTNGGGYVSSSMATAYASPTATGNNTSYITITSSNSNMAGIQYSSSSSGGAGLHTNASISQSDSSETSLHSSTNAVKTRFLPPVPPKPPKRGILKGSRGNISNIHEEIQISSPDSTVVLMRNTLQNEMLAFDSLHGHNPPYTSVESLRSDGGGEMASIMNAGGNSLNVGGSHSPINNLHVMTSPSPSAESLTDTTNSSFATPPFSLSPIGESQGIYRWSRVHAFEDIILPLPAIKLVRLPPPREFAIKRQKSPRNDFGFSLRKAICLDRTESLFQPSLKPVIFVEPGAGGSATGLLPGDRLLKVNGTSVDDLPGETIIELIRNSGESVTVQVQPVAEFVELSRRCMTNGESPDERDTDFSVNCNTLKRSASKRFKHESLRSAGTPPLGTPPSKSGAPLKAEIHRGCTGKAHATGTLKTKIVNIKPHEDHNHHAHRGTPPNQHRKNSVSSETISDSGSEFSSWNSNDLSQKPQNCGGGSVDGAGSGSRSTSSSEKTTNGANGRRRTIETLISVDETDKSPFVANRRRNRLFSDGDKEATNDIDNKCSFFQRNRSFRVNGSSRQTNGNANGNSPNNGLAVRPPWQSVYSKIKSPQTNGNLCNGTSNGLNRTASLNTRFRSSIRRRESVDWNSVWEKSSARRGDGSLYKNYEKYLMSNKARTDDDIEHGSDEHVWLVHKGGFTSALRLSQKANESGKVTIQLLLNGEQLTVDEDDIEKSNPSNLDLVEDICQLKHLNEASVLHCLRQRYASNLVHTKAGPILMVVNPMAPLSLYSEKVVSMFRGCKTEDMPPHIYSLAQTAYRTMLETRRDQSLIFMGRSGSGKTTSFRHALHYLALAAGSVNKLLTAEKVYAINTILEAFGNTKTCLNANATRFTQLLSLDFDHSGQIASASVQVLLLERSRAGKRFGNDHTFHILSRLLAGAEGILQKELHLDNISPEDNNPFVSLSQKLEGRHKAASEFTRVVQAFDTLNVDPAAAKGIWFILASIYHLGVAGATKIGSGPTSRIQFTNPSAARKAASLLGVSLEDLLAAAFPSTTSGSSSPARSPTETPESAWESLEGLVVGLYSEAMAAAVALINKAVCTSAHTIASILLVDTPGFQNPASCGVQLGASLSDLRHNYLQERLQLLFHHMTLVAPRDRYAQELVEIDTEGLPESHPGPLVSLIDKAPQSHVVRTSQRDLREQDRRGLLWLLDEESMYPNSNDDTFLDRLFSHYNDREHQTLIRRAVGTRQFVLQHLQGTNPVLYSAQGWLKASREHPAIKGASTLLQDSSKDEINRLFVGTLTRGTGVVFCGSVAGLEGTQSLRRVSSIRRSFTSAGVKRNSIMLQVKFTVDGIIDTLRRTGTHFVHCYLLQHNAGTHSIVSSSPNHTLHSIDDIVNVPLLRSQLRGSQVLEAARLHRLGFPESVPFSEFVRRFGLLGDVSSKELTVEQILTSNEIDPSSYRIGPSQVLFRSGILSQLEAKRDELLSDRIIQLQAYCRGYLARRRVAQRRVQELAVRCIQRNVRAFLAVRDWPWWRLLVRVAPLLNVHRTEEQLKIANDELQMLRAKLEKIENDRNALKTENDKLEAKLSEMTVDLTEERSAANITSERLEAETAERLKLEKELHEQQTKVKNLQETSEKLEMELICAKSDLNGISEDEDPDNDEGGGVYKLKYERVARELEFTKRRLQTQHEHDLEQLVGLKKQLEKKLSDAYEEVEEQRQVVGQWKRKAQKMTNEMNDLRMLLEEQNSRNNLLEKKQRKFDAECQSLQDAARQERQAKDRLAREKDVLIAEKFTLEQNLADARLELELKEEKLSALQRDIEEMTFGGGTEEEVAQLRRSKNDMERRLKEQEEELDDMAGQVQLLEQAKLRLEMTLETVRKEARREAQQRDEELEEARGSAYKKLKAMECQLESEHEERTLLLREKHELERRLQAMEEQDRCDRAAEEAANQKLRRDIRKYKALLKDAHAQLERLKADSPNKALIRQLRNQLEDAESSRIIAMKARQSAEAELADVQASLEDAQRARSEAEEKAAAAQRDRVELQTQIEENEEEMSELMKKYSATVKQLNNEQSALSEYEIRISELEAERNSLSEQVAELQTRLENIENMTDPSAAVQSKRLELRAKELESRLELEQATRTRLEIQSNRHKDAVEKLQNDISQTKLRELQAQDALKKAQKNLRELREEFHMVSNREQECTTRRKDLEKKLEAAEAEAASLRSDLRLALQRIADLQQAMEDGDEDVTESDESDSTDDSISDIEQRLRLIQAKRPSSSTPTAPLKETNGLSDTSLVIKEKKNENSPRITISSPGSGAKTFVKSGEALKNGDTSFA